MTEKVELTALAPVMLTNAVANFENGKIFLKANTFKNLLKNAIIYENLKKDKELFDEFYKKLLWWDTFERENKENLDEVKRQLEAVSLWLEKKVLCGGEPEIVNGEVINYDEEKNLLLLAEISDFEMLSGEVVKRKVKIVGKAKRFVGIRKFADRQSVFSGIFRVNGEKVEKYRKHAQKPVMFETFEKNDIYGVVNRFSLKVLEADKAFFTDNGYSQTVKKLEDIEAKSGNNLLKVNILEGILPYGVELFTYERIETPKGRKEYVHLNGIFQKIRNYGWSSEIFKGTREVALGGEPIGWLGKF